MNKKELKNIVSAASSLQLQLIHKPYVLVRIICIVNETNYLGIGFAKWNTQDMTMVNKAERLLKQVDPECCELCEATANACWNTLNRLDWSEERGFQIAYGRAVNDVVKQVMEKSSVGLSTEQYDPNKLGHEADIVVDSHGKEMFRRGLPPDNKRLTKIMNAKVENV